ncbi:MAG: NlpC/P60 family protein [Hyphomicrobiales bacterium]
MTAPDKRLFAFRADLAEDSLRGRIDAARFTTGIPSRVISPMASVKREPRPDAMQLTQALHGEDVTVFEDVNGWSWIKLKADGYVGYMESAALAPAAEPLTHEVAVPSSLCYRAPDLKTQPVRAMPLLSRFAMTAEVNGYRVAANGDALYARHLRPLGSGTGDFVAVAEQFLRVPYLWGGKSVAGIDCSGLVQLSLLATGGTAPRDSDMQEEGLGQSLKPQEKLRRGDLVFWPGHVGIMADGENLLHANAHHMMVVIEPLAAVTARSEAAGKPVSRTKRL